MKRIDLAVDAVSYADDQRLEHDGEPFTGEVVEQVGGQLVSQQFYVDGIAHGPEREWWADGGRKAEGEMRHGMPVGVHRFWHRNGQLAEEREFDDAGRMIRRRKWDENGDPHEKPPRPPPPPPPAGPGPPPPCRPPPGRPPTPRPGPFAYSPEGAVHRSGG
ncbi:toxin-antitoxin system YwqK family antitoxin, partial [Nocardia farcinica]|uniref:toxin-antitoxin system YwqK family antitoxin n=1 Tax=Nocardia farcinica TaxID=37329 RepID=UPI0024550F3C